MCASRCGARPTANSKRSNTRRTAPAFMTSLTETDGLLEFPEDVTAIEPGERVGFLSYASLIG